MASPPLSLTTLLARLAASGTDFLLVGGLAAVAQGAPLTTIDVDGTNCVGPAGSSVSSNGAGMAVDPRNGQVWFADCRRRLGRLTRLP